MSTDNEIIARSLGEPTAFAELFDRYARVIGAFAARRVGADAAEDVLSETFLVAFRRRASFDGQMTSAVPWLLGIAARLIRKQRANEAKHWRSVHASASHVDRPSSEGLERVAARLDAEETTKRLSAKISALPVRDRETLLLYAWGDLSYEEVAAALGVPVGTVRSRLNRVRRRLDPSRNAQAQMHAREEGHVHG